jgi:hypothetical protein
VELLGYIINFEFQFKNCQILFLFKSYDKNNRNFLRLMGKCMGGAVVAY